MKKHFGATMGLMVKSAKLLKSLKALKVVLSLSSMALFGFCESWILGVALAVCVLFLLFLHEMGHVVALKHKGFGIKLPFFVPFVGAVIFAPPFKSRQSEAYVGLGGPLLGTVAALLFAVPYYFTQQPLWLTASYLGLTLNFFNMIPISPFDGGRITQAADPRLRYLGYVALMGFVVLAREPGLLILWLLVIMDFNWTPERKLRWSRFVLFVMVILTALGVGKEPKANTFDCIFGTLLVGISEFFNWWRKRKLKRSGREAFPQISDEDHDRLYDIYLEQTEAEKCHPDKRAMPDMPTRCLWFALWASLAAVQFWIMLGEAQLMKTR